MIFPRPACPCSWCEFPSVVSVVANTGATYHYCAHHARWLRDTAPTALASRSTDELLALKVQVGVLRELLEEQTRVSRDLVRQRNELQAHVDGNAVAFRGLHEALNDLTERERCLSNALARNEKSEEEHAEQIKVRDRRIVRLTYALVQLKYNITAVADKFEKECG